MRHLARWLSLVIFLCVPTLALHAESVASLPAPTGYVNDFAHVLTPATVSSVDNLCLQVDRQAHAQIAVVTINTLDNDQSIEEFATELEEKWKVGPKGTDRGVLMILVMRPRRGRIEVGYGLEGILNDAKVGDIGRSMVPAAQQGDYNTAVPLGVRQIAKVISDDAGIALEDSTAQPTYQYRRQQQAQPVHLSLGQLIIGGAVIVFILFILVKTGNVGLIFFLLGNLMGGGGRRGRDDGWGGGGGGGFGGFGGGSSGGGGASGDF